MHATVRPRDGCEERDGRRSSSTSASRRASACSARSTSPGRSPSADSFNLEFQQLVTEYCWGAVWGRSGLTDRQRSLNNLCLLAALNRPEEFKTHFRGALAQRVHARRAARHVDPDHDLRRRPRRRRGVPARSPGARGRGHHPGAGAVIPAVLGFVGPRQHGPADGAPASPRPGSSWCASTPRAPPSGCRAGARDARERRRRRGERRHHRSSASPTARPRSRSRTTSPRADDRRVTTVIDLSTVGPGRGRGSRGDCSRASASRYVDGPVSGGVAGARAGTISLMFGGPSEVLDAHRPILDAFAGNVFHVGPTCRAGPGDEAAQQLPVGHRARRDVRGARLRRGARPRA